VLTSVQNINYIEFGVYQGETIKFWSEKLTDPTNNFFGFDTFTGLPEAWMPGKAKGHFSLDGVVPNLEDESIYLFKGLFQETLPKFIGENSEKLKCNRNIIHLDADLYSSTLFVLMAFSSILKNDDILIFDEFSYPMLHEFRAFENFLESCPINVDCIGSTTDFTQIAFRIRL